VNESIGATNYRWDFGDTGTAADTSLSATPNWTYAQPGTYTVQLVAAGPGPCFDTATTIYDVYLNLFPTFEPPEVRCPGEPAEFVLGGAFSSDAEVIWDFGAVGSPQNSNGNTASAAFLPVGVHPVTVSVTDNGCSGSFTDSVTVFPFPVADFTSDTRSCVGATFGFQDLSTAATALSYLWDFGDGVTSTEAEPFHQYVEPGMYTVALTVSTDSGCISSNTTVRPAQVEVFPNPVAAFSALPREVSVFQPDISIEDFSVNAVSWEYDVEGNTFLVPDLEYSFQEGGQFIITLRVFSENGCPDVTTRTVFVSDHIFWAPNAFTPDGDGLNDTWTPMVIGARTYELEIFDRWGNLRFRTDDPKQGWDGEGLPATIFTYRVRIKEWGADSKEYVGHFSLLR
jgi:gliding motility-associated-like protein